MTTTERRDQIAKLRECLKAYKEAMRQAKADGDEDALREARRGYAATLKALDEAQPKRRQ